MNLRPSLRFYNQSSLKPKLYKTVFSHNMLLHLKNRSPVQRTATKIYVCFRMCMNIEVFKEASLYMLPVKFQEEML